MPPKGWVKAKGKGKGRGKGKAKAKARAAPVEQTAGAEGANAEGDEVLTGEGAIVPVAKAKSKGVAAIRKKIIDSLGEQSLEDAMSDAKSKLQKENALIEELAALQVAQEKQVEEAQKEFDEVKAEVAAAMEKETKAARVWAEMKQKKREAGEVVDQKRADLLEAQKKLAMLEVTALNHARAVELEAKKSAALEATAKLKQKFADEKQKQKEALEATRQALAEARKGVKRAAADIAAEKAADVAAGKGVDEMPAKRAAASPQHGHHSISSMPTVVDTPATVTQHDAQLPLDVE